MDPKEAAGRSAARLVEDGMLVGLGTGTTAAFFISALGERVRSGLRVTGVPTSAQAERLALAGGIALAGSDPGELDLTVDGADEVNPGLDLVKGAGGAMLREKVVAAASRRFVVVATEDKLVRRLGRGPLPVEVTPFLWHSTARQLRQLQLEPQLRGGDAPFVTDNGNWVLDCLGAGAQPPLELASRLASVAGVMSHGLFLGMCRLVLVGNPDGSVRELRPQVSPET
ncbi:MAG: ribose-5-phosphate isomerase RpiA [Candidatus Dormibacteria bacterium]